MTSGGGLNHEWAKSRLVLKTFLPFEDPDHPLTHLDPLGGDGGVDANELDSFGTLSRGGHRTPSEHFSKPKTQKWGDKWYKWILMCPGHEYNQPTQPK